MLKNVNSGLYLEVANGSAEAGANLQQWGADGAAAHNTWRAVSAGDGYYYLYSQVGDKITYLMDISGRQGRQWHKCRTLDKEQPGNRHSSSCSLKTVTVLTPSIPGHLS